MESVLDLGWPWWIRLTVRGPVVAKVHGAQGERAHADTGAGREDTIASQGALRRSVGREDCEDVRHCAGFIVFEDLVLES